VGGTADITGLDPDGDQVTLEASGAPFQLAESPAVMTPPTDFGLNPTFQFTWNTQCSHIRKMPYQVVIHAKDDSFPIPLTNVHAINISVIGPAIENLTASPTQDAVELSWTPYSYCSNLASIRVYRKTGSSPYEPDPCETGVRPGYKLIAELDPDASSFTDDNGGTDFIQGVDYCYRVVALFLGGAESQPSDEACARMSNDRPLMTQVSHDPLDLESGALLLSWAKPQEIASYYTEPYSYRLIRVLNGESTSLYSGADTTFRDLTASPSTAQSLYYQVEMLDASQQLMGTSATAAPVVLTGTGGDKVASLSWTEAVPWTIDSTEVFREYDTVFVRSGAPPP